LGRPSRHEQIALIVTACVLVGFATQPLHGIEPAWVGVVALAVLAGTGVLTANGLGAVNWSFALLSGILTSMSDVFANTKLDRWLAGIATQALGDFVATPVLFVAALTILCYGLSLVLRHRAPSHHFTGAGRARRGNRPVDHRPHRARGLQRVLPALPEHNVFSPVPRHERPSVQPQPGSADGGRLRHGDPGRTLPQRTYLAGNGPAVTPSSTKQRGSMLQHAPSSA
jgi:hypothetical protein